jgi:hypothetical protein
MARARDWRVLRFLRARVEVSSVERNVCHAWLAEEGRLSPHLAVVELYGNPGSFEGLGMVGECHFGAWARRIEELVIDLSYRMGPCGTVEELRSCDGDLQE